MIQRAHRCSRNRYAAGSRSSWHSGHRQPDRRCDDLTHLFIRVIRITQFIQFACTQRAGTITPVNSRVVSGTDVGEEVPGSLLWAGWWGSGRGKGMERWGSGQGFEMGVECGWGYRGAGGSAVGVDGEGEHPPKIRLARSNRNAVRGIG